jgi:hypothetical protein
MNVVYQVDAADLVEEVEYVVKDLDGNLLFQVIDTFDIQENTNLEGNQIYNTRSFYDFSTLYDYGEGDFPIVISIGLHSSDNPTV